MEGDAIRAGKTNRASISIHSLRREGDFRHRSKCCEFRNFNPLPPHGGRPHFAGFVIVTLDISIHSLRMEGDKNGYPQKKHISSFQSTPSAWRETGAMHRIERLYYISIHSLRMEGDDNGMIGYFSGMHFNPLPPHGGRHYQNREIIRTGYHFNPLPPHGGRPHQNCGMMDS